MQRRPSRRSVLASAGALALAGLAGCTGGDAESDPTAEPTATATSDPSVDWSEVAEFRTWLTEYSTLPSSNARFDYQQVNLDQVVGVGRTSVFDVAPEDADGALVQSANVVVLGDFDRESLVADLEASEDHEVTGEYEGYATAEAAETATEYAVGGDAVLAGSELAVWIDTHLGERERLEEADPVFTRIFERLPDRGLVTGQYGTPAGGEIDAEAIEAWGHSMPSLAAGEGTWVYALEPDTGEAAVDELAAELGESAFVTEVTDRAVDGRFVAFTAETRSLD
ncbi:hypothetical protein [Halobacterium hubeiense]|uniref:hypothetical protein n=1 Tax=Halobacterium hubeiense TaxID=1407499 RepID=UPI003C72D278